MEIVAIVIVLGGFGLIVWGLLAFVRAIFKSLSAPAVPNIKAAPSASDEIDGMNNGDYYNGPHGYSPMTGYPETQYGSGFDEDAEWHEER